MVSKQWMMYHFILHHSDSDTAALRTAKVKAVNETKDRGEILQCW